MKEKQKFFLGGGGSNTRQGERRRVIKKRLRVLFHVGALIAELEFSILTSFEEPGPKAYLKLQGIQCTNVLK